MLGFYRGTMDDEYAPEFFEVVAVFQLYAGLKPVDIIFERVIFVALLRRQFPYMVDKHKVESSMGVGPRQLSEMLKQ